MQANKKAKEKVLGAGRLRHETTDGEVDFMSVGRLISLLLLMGCSGDKVTDTDGDGLSDSQEAAYGTDPNRADTDNGGLFDNKHSVSGTVVDAGVLQAILPTSLNR